MRGENTPTTWWIDMPDDYWSRINVGHGVFDWSTRPIGVGYLANQISTVKLERVDVNHLRRVTEWEPDGVFYPPDDWFEEPEDPEPWEIGMITPPPNEPLPEFRTWGKDRITFELGDPRHGTMNGYINLSCRCGDCKYAQQLDYRKKKRKKEAALERARRRQDRMNATPKRIPVEATTTTNQSNESETTSYASCQETSKRSPGQPDCIIHHDLEATGRQEEDRC
jgi:hypothetical protein